MLIKDENDNEVDSLFGKTGSEESSDNNGGEGEGSNSPQVIELNKRKYDLSKPEDVKAMAEDYVLQDEKYKAQQAEVGEARKITEAAKGGSDEGKTEQADPKQEEYDRKMIEKYGIVTKEQLAEQDYQRSKSAKLNEFVQKLGLTYDDVNKEIEESNTNTGVRLDPAHLEDWYAARHPKEYREARQKLVRADHPGNHYTESTSKGGMELPDEEVPQFGKNVVEQGLELIGQSSGE